jgi:predicted metal-dependent HD superfamily phosphohydrolase
MPGMRSRQDTNLAKSWRALLAAVGARADCETSFAAIAAAYGEPHRHYHTLEHIAACLDAFSLVRQQAEAPDQVALAIWYHDIVYDTHRGDNEECSAERAVAFCESAGLADTSERVAALVLATKHTDVAVGDAALLNDIDLSILGQDATAFDRYDSQIREEYAWVPEAMYRRERAKILQGFLDRPAIYRTAVFKDRFESQARNNLARSLATLSARPSS